MSSSKLSKNHHYGCIGREEKQKKLMELWRKDNKRIIYCHGGKESGKSCFIRNFLDHFIQNETSDSIIIDTDFKLDRIGPKDSLKFWKNLTKKLAREKVVTEINDTMTEEILDNFFEEIKERKIIFLLDNLDYAQNTKSDDKSSNTEQDLFTELQDNFIPGIVERTDLNMVFVTSTVQLGFGKIAPRVCKIEMDPLSTEGAKDLLLKVIECTSDGCMDTEAAREHLGPYLQHIALLSEGIPTAIIVTGSQLTENNFFIRPNEMLTVLIFSRMYTLSPELFPKEDNMLKTYGDYVEKQSDGMKKRLQEISQTEESRFEVEELMQQLSTKDGKAHFKLQTVKPLLLRSFLMNVGELGKSDTLEMPGFLRELFMIQEIIDPSKGLSVEDRLACIKVVSDCLHRLGKNLDEEKLIEIIKSPQKYDEFVKQTISNATQEENIGMDTHKELEKNDLGKPKFQGYSPESILPCAWESDLSGLHQQKMQNLKLSEKDIDQDSHSSPNPGIPNENIQGQQKKNYFVPGQLYEHVKRYNHNVSNMSPGMERSPQSISHAGFIYKGNGVYECQYCENEIHQSDLTGNVDLMQKHQEIDPRCPFVHLHHEYGQNSSQQVKDKEALNERRGSERTEGGNGVSSTTARHSSKNSMEESEREYLEDSVKEENVEDTNGMDTKNDKFDNSSNLSSSYGNKQCPVSKMDFLEMEGQHHTGPKETENLVGFSANSSSELNNVKEQCTKQTDRGAEGNNLCKIDKNTARKTYVEHRENRVSKEDEGYHGSPPNSDSDDQESPDPGVMKNAESA